jgi:type VI secretion system protein VasG
MSRPNIKSLIGKLNETCRKALESAAGLCLSQTHYEVDIEHFLLKLLEMPETDLQKIVRHFEINETRLINDMTQALEGFKRGNARTPALSPHIPAVVQDAWLIASIDQQTPLIRSGHIILALMSSDEMSRMLLSSSGEFKKISVETLNQHFMDILSGSREESEAAAAPGMAPVSPGGIPAKGTKALDQFTISLTDKACKGDIDPVLGRDFEIRQMIDILIRRRQNNPILTGEAGVGKTAVVEGFAQRLAAGDVPPALKDVVLRTLDIGLLQAGASMKGEFEQRLRQVI